MNEIIVNNVGTAAGTKRYTFQMWVYAYNFANDTFQGIEAEWNLHNKIEIINTSGTYTYVCYPFFEEGDTTSIWNNESLTLPFEMSKWNFLSCASDVDGSIYYSNTEFGKASRAYSDFTPTLTALTTTFKMRDKTNATNRVYGHLFIRQIRLWEEAYSNVAYLARLEILTKAYFSRLVRTWDTYWRADGLCPDVQDNSFDFTVTYYPVVDRTNFDLEANIVRDGEYETLFLCSENSQYYSPRRKNCVRFVNLANIPDFDFVNIPPVLHGAYTMEFWVFTEDFRNVAAGVNVVLTDTIGITIKKDPSDTLGAYCFPQGYKYKDHKDKVGSEIDDLYNEFQPNTYLKRYIDVSGKWSWVRCAVSIPAKKFYVTDAPVQTIQPEVVYKASGTEIYNDYPYKSYFRPGDNMTIHLRNMDKQTSRVYFRNLLVFNDYLPQDFIFKYMDLSKVERGPINTVANLVFAVNFEDFDDVTGQLPYSTYLFNQVPTTIPPVLTPVAEALAANFDPLPLCNPTFTEKYDASTNLCTPITACNLGVLQASYCFEENQTLSCLDSYYININNDGTASCNQSCPTGSLRTPGIFNSRSVCGYDNCQNVVACPNTSNGLLRSYINNYNCQDPGYTRIDYKCYPNTKLDTSAFYFSRCTYPLNIYHNFSTTSINKLQDGHILEFWFYNDNYNNTCADRNQGRHYYWHSWPHIIYYDTVLSMYRYEFAEDTSISSDLATMSLYEWNRIIIKTTFANPRQVTIFVNYRFDAPAFTFTVPATTQLELRAVAFCNNTYGPCLPNGNNLDIDWGSAYYKEIRVWDVSIASEFLTQSFGTLFTEMLQSLVNYFPMEIDNMDLNVVKNTVRTNFDSIDMDVNYSSTLYYHQNADKNMLLNFSTNFDFGATRQKFFVNNITSTGNQTTACDPNCLRCYSGVISLCYVCDTNYVLEYSTCKRVTNYYLKVPPLKEVSSMISLKVAGTLPDVFNFVNEATWSFVFWIKFFGVLDLPNVSAIPVIVQINSNTFLGYDIARKSLVLQHNSQDVFVDNTFPQYFGQWINISIANWKSDTISGYFPNLMTLMVHKKDIPMQPGFTIPSSGFQFNKLDLGFEITALFGPFRFYDSFYQGGYGKVLRYILN